MRNKLSIDPYSKFSSETKIVPLSNSSRRNNEYSYTQVSNDRNQNGAEFISMVDDYLSRRIDFVNQSRSNEVQQLTRIKNSLQQKLGQIKVNPEDIPYKRSVYPQIYPQSKPSYTSNLGKKVQLKTPNRGLDMISFETQIDQCDRLLNDLGAKCRQYASVESVKVYQPMRYKIKTEARNQPEIRQRKLPLLKSKRSATQQVYNYHNDMDNPFRKKYDHTGEALLVVPFNVNQNTQHRKSEAPTSRNPYVPTRSRRSSIDNKNLISQKKRQIQQQSNTKEDNQTIQHRRKKSPTIDVHQQNTPKIRDSGMSFHPLKVKRETPINSKTIDQNINTNDSYLRSHQTPRKQNQKQIGTQNSFANSEYQQQKIQKDSYNNQSQKKSRELKRKQSQRGRSRSKSRQNQKRLNYNKQDKFSDKASSKREQTPSKQLTQKSHSKSKDSKQSASNNGRSSKSPINLSKQKSIIPQLSMAKMRGMKLYQRIKQYKSKASIK